MLSAACQLFDTGDGVCLLPGAKPPPSTLALLLSACGRHGDGALLAGVWRHLGPPTRAPGGGAPPPWPARRVVRALVEAAAACDVRGAGLLGGAAATAGPPDSSSTHNGGSDGPAAASITTTASASRVAAASRPRAVRYGGSLAAALLSSDGALAELLADLAELYPQLIRRGQPSRRSTHTSSLSQQPAQCSSRACSSTRHSTKGSARYGGPPLPLVSPDALLALLKVASSAADVDVLLLSQLAQPAGLPMGELRRLSRARPGRGVPGCATWDVAGGGTAGAAALAGGSSPACDRMPLSDLLDACVAAAGSSAGARRASLGATGGSARPMHLPLGRGGVGGDATPAAAVAPAALFPPPLPPPVAAAAVSAYMRFGARSRAAAVARAAASSAHQDQQAAQRFIAEAARAGMLLPALNAAEALRSGFWRAPCPTAAAALLRCAAAAAGPPLGVSCAPAQLLAVWRRHGVRHPTAWGALVRGLWELGSRSRLAAHSPPLQHTQRQQPDAIRTLQGPLAGQELALAALLAAMDAPLELPGAPAGGSGGCTAEGVAARGARGFSTTMPRRRGTLCAGPEPTDQAEGAAAAKDTLDRARSQIVGELIAGILSPLPPPAPPSAALQPSASCGDGGARLQPPLGGRRRLRARGHPHFDAAAPGRGAPLALFDDVPGLDVVLPLHLEQQPGAAQRVEATAAVLRLLSARGVTIRDDTALAAALQALRLCRHGGEAHASGARCALMQALSV